MLKTKLEFKPHPSWPNHGWIEGLTEEDDALLHVDTAEAVLEHIEQLEDHLEMLMRYMARQEQDDMRGGAPISWWDIFSCEEQLTAAELGKWLEERNNG